jgi:hypothetical protein
MQAQFLVAAEVQRPPVARQTRNWPQEDPTSWPLQAASPQPQRPVVACIGEARGAWRMAESAQELSELGLLTPAWGAALSPACAGGRARREAARRRAEGMRTDRAVMCSPFSSRGR